MGTLHRATEPRRRSNIISPPNEQQDPYHVLGKCLLDGHIWSVLRERHTPVAATPASPTPLTVAATAQKLLPCLDGLTVDAP